MKHAEPGAVCLLLHLPKTAGSTLKHCVYDEYAVEAPAGHRWLHDGIYYFPYGFHKARRPRYTPAVREMLERDDVRAVVGHFWFGLHRHLRGPSFYITLLRDPVDRVVSLYHHILRKESEPLHVEVASRAVTLEEFVSELGCREADNDQTRRLAGHEPPFGEVDEGLLALAKRHLDDHFAFVGVTERFDESLVALRRRLQWEYVLYLPMLVNPNRPPKSSLPPETVALIASTTATTSRCTSTPGSSSTKQSRRRERRSTRSSTPSARRTALTSSGTRPR